ncbi:hypothetical protein CEF21_17350 [Bacillus sp. FJAT-42376]|nr:hypothetical protein CEF21_17350 [Bacillus sp. FJAT-42376]
MMKLQTSKGNAGIMFRLEERERGDNDMLKGADISELGLWNYNFFLIFYIAAVGYKTNDYG